MTYLLRLSACLFFLLSFNAFAASVFYVTGSGTIRSYDLEENTHSYITDGPWYEGGLAYGENNLFYVTGSGTIHSYDLEENTHSYITDGPWFAGGLAYGENNLFYVTGSGTIHSYDLEENTHSYITDGPWFAGGLAYQPSPVPLPAGIYLFLSGLVGLGLIRGRNG